jgi:hypothetical protein
MDKPVYEPLSWRLHRVDTCLIHQCKLVHRCPACNAQFVTLTNKSSVGYCPKCQTWLGCDAYSGEPISSTSESNQLSQTIGDLLALTPRLVNFNVSSVSQVIETIHQSRRMPYTHIQSAIHISMTTFLQVKSGKGLLNLNSLAHLAMLSEGMLWESLAGQTTCVQRRGSSEPSQLKTRAQKTLYLEQLLASSDPLPVSLLNIARTCGYSSAGRLRIAFPTQYARLRIRLYDEQRQALQDILDGDAIMAVHELARRRGYVASVIFRRFPELCRQVAQVYRERKLSHTRQYLQELIQTNHFPCLTAITKTLGVGSYYLTQHFPDELRFIEAQRQYQIQQQAKATEDYLDASLASDTLPPTSLQQIAAELGKDVGTLHHAFPVQARKILERRREYMANQLQIACEQIQQAVFELHQQGFYPGINRLHGLIGAWLVHGTAHHNAYIEAMTKCGYPDLRG